MHETKSNKKKRVLLGIAAVAAIGAGSSASASIITYTDRATWTSNAGTPDFTVDFEGFAADTSFATAPLDVGPFTLSADGTPPSGRDIVDVSPFSYPPVPASFGNAAADIFVEGASLTANLTFDTAVRAFFADFLYAGNDSQLDLTLQLAGGGSADVLVPGPGTGAASFGFISTADAITSIRFNNSVNDGFYVDNLSGAGASTVSGVPEPSTFALFGLGLAGLGLSRRKRS